MYQMQCVRFDVYYAMCNMESERCNVDCLSPYFLHSAKRSLYNMCPLMRTLHAIMTTSSFPYKYLWAHMQTFFEAYQQFSLAIFKLELSYNN